MRKLLTIAAIAGLATVANATPSHRHAARADSGSAAVRELNEKSLQQASAGAPMTSPTGTPAMSDSGAAAPMSPMNSGSASSSTMTPSPTNATPTSPTTPQ